MINNLLKKTWNPLALRIFAAVGFVYILAILYFGSLKIIFNLDDNLVMFVLWTLWWPFLYIILFFLGRFWCGFICPIGLVNEFGNSVRKSKKDFLSKYKFIPFALFFIIVLWEQIFGLFSSTKITLVFLSTFLISAFLVGLILPRWGFCKHFCPIGALFGPFSRLSILSVRTNKKLCMECKTKECIRGGVVEPCPMFNDVPNLSSNKDCLLCTNCIKNCPHKSANLSILFPGEELKRKTGFNLAESLFIISLLGFSTILTSKGTEMFRASYDIGNWIRAFDFIFAIGSFILFYLILTYLSTRLEKPKKGNFKSNLVDGGYVYLPLAFSIMFFTIVFGFITPLTNIDDSLIAFSKYILLAIGGIWSILTAVHLFKKRSIIHIIGILLVVVFWIAVLIPGPLNFSKNESKIYYIQNNETLSVKAFSMGFDPDIIMAKKGDNFYLNITDSDIMHSFDIDKMNIHLHLEGGKSKTIKIEAVEQGRYEYYCAIPGHKEAGMKGVLIVE